MKHNSRIKVLEVKKKKKKTYNKTKEKQFFMQGLNNHLELLNQF